jgi:hypothetical protein
VPLFFYVNKEKLKMNKQELDAKIETLTKKQRKEIGLLLDESGQKAFDDAITAGKSQDEATILAEQSALKAGEEFLAGLVAAKIQNAPAKEIPTPAIENNLQRVNWGGFTLLQIDSCFKDFPEALKKAFPEDTEIRILNFTGAQAVDRANGKKYRISATGNKSGIKKILV